MSEPADPWVCHLLSNRYYLGVVTFKGVEYQGRHQPIIPPSLFDRVQEVLSMNHAGEKQRTYRHYLKSTVYCAGCGSRLCLTNARGQYLYFFCLGRHQRRTNCTLPYIPVAEIEAAVERHYATVRIPDDVQDDIRQGLRAELDHQRDQAEPEIAHARRRVTELEEERRRLARGVVTGSIPEDLAREEQDRIRRELEAARRILATAEIIYAKIESTLNQALAFVGRVGDVYRLGGPKVRRLSNQFFFDQLLIAVDEDDLTPYVAGAVLREPWATLLARDFQAQMARHNTPNPGQDLLVRGSKDDSLVPPAGFEPATHGLGNRCLGDSSPVARWPSALTWALSLLVRRARRCSASACRRVATQWPHGTGVISMFEPDRSTVHSGAQKCSRISPTNVHTTATSQDRNRVPFTNADEVCGDAVDSVRSSPGWTTTGRFAENGADRRTAAPGQDHCTGVAGATATPARGEGRGR